MNIKLVRKWRGSEKESCKVSWIQFFGFRDITKKLVIRPKNPPVMNGVNRITMTEKKILEKQPPQVFCEKRCS